LRTTEAAGAEREPTADPVLLPIPAFEFDQRIVSICHRRAT